MSTSLGSAACQAGRCVGNKTYAVSLESVDEGELSRDVGAACGLFVRHWEGRDDLSAIGRDCV
jgi:hypothetical protein